MGVGSVHALRGVSEGIPKSGRIPVMTSRYLVLLVGGRSDMLGQWLQCFSWRGVQLARKVTDRKA